MFQGDPGEAELFQAIGMVTSLATERSEPERGAVVSQLRAGPGLLTDRAGAGQLPGATRPAERQDQRRQAASVPGARRAADDPAHTPTSALTLTIP